MEKWFSSEIWKMDWGSAKATNHCGTFMWVPLCDIIVQYRLTLQSQSMGMTLGFKQGAAKGLELDDINDPLVHMARMDMQLLGN